MSEDSSEELVGIAYVNRQSEMSWSSKLYAIFIIHD